MRSSRLVIPSADRMLFQELGTKGQRLCILEQRFDGMADGMNDQ